MLAITLLMMMQVGAFYEAIGIDAVLLMEHCGLNAMGGTQKEVPRAGCPEANLQQHLDQLVQGAGLDVVRLLLDHTCWIPAGHSAWSNNLQP